MIAAVIGSPISHSLSPKLFSFMATNEGVDIDYQAIDVSLADSKEFLETLKKNKNFRGLNVTIPLKEVFLDQIDDASPEVKIIGALNVLHIKDDKIYGHNTDVIGIERTLKEKKFSIDGKACLLLGAGGAAKATAYVLGKQNAKVVYVYNLSDKNVELVKNFQTHFPNTKWVVLNEKSPELNPSLEIDLVVNSTPLGMTGKDSGEEFFKVVDLVKFKEGALAFDLVYTPAETEFIKKLKGLQVATIGGLGMLIYQALGTWSIWNGEISNEPQMRADLAFFLSGILKLRQKCHSLYLTGFMGVGKSHVGRHLARLLDLEFIDTDLLLEKNEGEKISVLFKNKGEAYFRQKESECIKNVVSQSLKKNVIVALGGGALIKEDNLETIVKGKGQLIYLKADLTILNQRILKNEKEDHVIRPILFDLSESDRLKKMKELFSVREFSYKKAMLHIETDLLNAPETAYKIIKMIGENPKFGEVAV